MTNVLSQPDTYKFGYSHNP